MSSRSKTFSLSLLAIAAAACLSLGVWFLYGQRRAADSPAANRSSAQSAARGKSGVQPSVAEGASTETLPAKVDSGSDDAAASRSGFRLGGGRSLSGGGSADGSAPKAGRGAEISSVAQDDESTATAELAVLVRWADSRQPIPDVPVVLYQGPRPEGEPRIAMSDADGNALVRYPSDWRQGCLTVRKAYTWFSPRAIPLPAAKAWKIDIARAFSAHGRVYSRDEKGAAQPAAGATVLAAGKKSEKTLSQEDGSWRIEQIPESQVSLIAVCGNRRSACVGKGDSRVVLAPEEDNGPYDLYLEKDSLTLTGAVLRAEDLKPVEGATVRIDALSLETTSDAGGLFMIESLPEGEFDVSVSAQGYADERSRVLLDEGKEAAVMFRLKPGGTIHVLALDRDGAPVERGQLFFYPSFPGRGGKTDAQGRVDIERVPTDVVYTLHVWSNPHSSTRATVQFEPGQTDVDTSVTFQFSQAEEDKPEAHGVFVGSVTDEKGRPIGGATVHFRQPWRVESEPNIGLRTQTGPDGRYREEMRSASSGMNSNFDVSAYAEGWATQWKDSGRAGTQDNPAQVDFQLRPERTALGVVVDAQGNPLEGVQVVASPVSNPSYRIAGQPDTFTRRDGAFWIRGLDGDKVCLSLRKSGWRPVLIPEAATDQETRVEMHRLSGALRGRVVDAQTRQPIPDFSVRINYGEKGPYSVFDEEGRFVVGELNEEQDYRVHIESTSYDPLETHAKAGPAEGVEEIVFAMSRPTPLAGVVVDAATGQPVAGATVLAGRSQGGGNWIDWRATSSLEDWTSVQSGADGRFSIGVSGGDFLVAARADGYAPFAVPPAARAQYADAASGGLRIPLGRGATLTCSYVLDGQPQANRQVLLQVRDESNGLAALVGQSQTDASGIVVWEHVPAGLAVVKSLPVAESAGPVMPDYRTVRLNEGDSKRIDLGEFPGSATVHGSVLLDGTPQPNFRVLYQPTSGADGGPGAGMSDAQGRYRIVGLVPGSYIVSVFALTGEPDQSSRMVPYQVKNNSVALAAGETRHDIQVSPPAAPTPTAP